MQNRGYAALTIWRDLLCVSHNCRRKKAQLNARLVLEEKYHIMPPSPRNSEWYRNSPNNELIKTFDVIIPHRELLYFQPPHLLGGQRSRSTAGFSFLHKDSLEFWMFCGHGGLNSKFPTLYDTLLSTLSSLFSFLKMRLAHFVISFSNSCLCSSSSAVQASSVINGPIERRVKNLQLRRGVSR